MPIREVRFVSREIAETLLFYPDTAAISIIDPGKRLAALPSWFRAVLRLSFYDAIPGDDFMPAPLPGCFDYRMAKQIVQFLDALHAEPLALRLIIHCEQGLSRSAAVALFSAAYTGAALMARERAGQANPWVLSQLNQLKPEVDVDIPPLLDSARPPAAHTPQWSS